jgi:quercetin dioxygenase-like cupin family protein
MAFAISETSVAPEQIAPGVNRQRLLTAANVKGTSLLLDRLTLGADATAKFELSAQSLGWIQLFDGVATINTGFSTERLSATASVVLPPGFSGSLWSEKGVAVVYAEVPDIVPLDPGFPATRPHFAAVDWKREAVLLSERDGRKRIGLCNSDICDSAALRVEMVVYPKGGMAPMHRQDGAAKALYIADGRGMVQSNGQQILLRVGDAVHFADGEPHSLAAAADSELRFIELHAPSRFKTVWADPASASVWRNTNLTIGGYMTERDDALRRI